MEVTATPHVSPAPCPRPRLTTISVPGEVTPVNHEVVVGVQLPELAVDDVEMLIGEEVGQLVDVRLRLQQRHGLGVGGPR